METERSTFEFAKRAKFVGLRDLHSRSGASSSWWFRSRNGERRQAANKGVERCSVTFPELPFPFLQNPESEGIKRNSDE